jgi:hypothetical protein
MNEFSALVFMHGVIGGRTRGPWMAGLISVSRKCVSSSESAVRPSSLDLKRTAELIVVDRCVIPVALQHSWLLDYVGNQSSWVRRPSTHSTNLQVMYDARAGCCKYRQQQMPCLSSGRECKQPRVHVQLFSRQLAGTPQNGVW